MKKRIATLAVAGVLVGATVVGGTLAYFTDSEEQKNVVTMGRVDITLKDELSEESGGMVDRIVPNQTIKDAVSVSNTGKNDAFIRLAVDYSKSDISGEDVLKTFVGAYKQESGALSFDTEAEAQAKVAEYEAMGVTASYEKKEVQEVLETELPTENTAGHLKIWYDTDYTDDNGVTWFMVRYCKPNLNGSYVIQGVKYVNTSATNKVPGFIPGIHEPVTDNVEYVNVQNDENGYRWVRRETVTTTKYVVTFADYSYAETGISDTVWAAVNDEENGICYYYYDGVLKTGETVSFLDSLHIPAEWGNAYADKSIVLNITAEAIQSDFLEDASGNAITDAQTAFANVTIE